MAAAPAAESDGLTLVVRTLSGHAAEDPAGFLLVDPRGRAEPVRLDGGRFERPSAPPGEHRARFRYLRGAAWSSSAIRCGEEVELAVQAPGFDEGEELRFEIRERWQPDAADPVATLTARVSRGAATASWRHEQAAGGPARAEYVFAAVLGAKWAESGVLLVSPQTTSTYAGVKQLLVRLGYDCGPPGPESSPELTQALH